MLSLSGKKAEAFSRLAPAGSARRELGQSDEILIAKFTNIYPAAVLEIAE
jgi:hypothetical protein